MERWQLSLLEKFPEVKEKFEQEYKEEIEFIRKSMIDELSSHQWWKENDIREMNLELNEVDQRVIFTNCMLNFSESFLTYIKKGENEINNFFNTLEEEVSRMTEKEKDSFDLFIIESLINRAENKENFDTLYNNAGPEVKKLCERNINRGAKEKFWKYKK